LATEYFILAIKQDETIKTRLPLRLNKNDEYYWMLLKVGGSGEQCDIFFTLLIKPFKVSRSENEFIIV